MLVDSVEPKLSSIGPFQFSTLLNSEVFARLAQPLIGSEGILKGIKAPELNACILSRVKSEFL